MSERVPVMTQPRPARRPSTAARKRADRTTQPEPADVPVGTTSEEPMPTQAYADPEVLVSDPYAPAEVSTPAMPEPGPRNSRLASVPALRPLSPTPTFIGIGVAAVGFVLLAIAWGQVAGESNVALQMPYLISGGLFGLALVMVGLTVVSVAAKRRDAATREQQTQLLADALTELRRALGGDDR